MLFRGIFIVIFLEALTLYAYACNLDVGNETYEMLEVFEAKGIIKKGILTLRPITLREFGALIKEAQDSGLLSDYDREALARLKKK